MPAPSRGRGIQTAPEKGVFPLDHGGECKKAKEEFMGCIKTHNNSHEPCKALSRSYLQCRMDCGLMQKENLDMLGLKAEGEVNDNQPRVKAYEAQNKGKRKEAEGFVAGTFVKTR
eukprot:460839_1